MKRCRPQARCRRTGKVQFPTRLAAEIVLAKLKWRDTGVLRSYRCEFCNQWHLTSQAKGKGVRT